MIKHIVMFKLKPAEGKTLAETAAEAKEKALALKGKVPSLRNIEVQVNSESAPADNFTIALICDFDDICGLNEYQIHPDHKAFGAYLAGIREEGGRACIDFEI